MSIYTKTGDQGQTSLANGQRVSKNDNLINAYGTADELNAFVGFLRAALAATNETKCKEQLLWIQQRLFNLGASLAKAPGDWISEEDASQLEKWMDCLQEQLPPLHAFVLPADSEIVARCHICRTITRRLERAMIGINNENYHEMIFVNRLSDYFYLIARYFEQKCDKNTISWDRAAKVKN